MLTSKGWSARRNCITLHQHMELMQCHLLMQNALESVLAGSAACRDRSRTWAVGWDLEMKLLFVYSDVD